MEHWTRKLPEVGTPFLRQHAEPIEEAKAEIERAKQQIRRLKDFIRRAECAASKDALRLWTGDEIAAAKFRD